MLSIGSQNENDHPLITEFVDLVNETVSENVLDFADIQSKPFIRFWPNLLILKAAEDKANRPDAFIKLWGGAWVGAPGSEMTGKNFSEINLGNVKDEILKTHLKSLKDREMFIAYSLPNWTGMNFEIGCRHVTFPLKRRDGVTETLTCASFK